MGDSLDRRLEDARAKRMLKERELAEMTDQKYSLEQDHLPDPYLVSISCTSLLCPTACNNNNVAVL